MSETEDPEGADPLSPCRRLAEPAGGQPFIERLRDDAVLTAALTAITAAVVGVILNLAVWFGMHVVFNQVTTVTHIGLNIDVPLLASVNLPALGLALAAVAAVFRFGFGPVTVLAGCAIAGLALRASGIA